MRYFRFQNPYALICAKNDVAAVNIYRSKVLKEDIPTKELKDKYQEISDSDIDNYEIKCLVSEYLQNFLSYSEFREDPACLSILDAIIKIENKIYSGALLEDSYRHPFLDDLPRKVTDLDS